MNEAISACRLLKVEGSYMRVSTVFYNEMNEAISAYRLLKVEGSYIQVSIVLEAIVLVSIIENEAISACRLLKMEGSSYDSGKS